MQVDYLTWLRTKERDTRNRGYSVGASEDDRAYFCGIANAYSEAADEYGSRMAQMEAERTIASADEIKRLRTERDFYKERHDAAHKTLDELGVANGAADMSAGLSTRILWLAERARNNLRRRECK